MLRTDWDKKICAEYKPKDCEGCPLKLNPVGGDACKATHHWNKQKGEWMADDETVRGDS